MAWQLAPLQYIKTAAAGSSEKIELFKIISDIPTGLAYITYAERIACLAKYW